MILLFPALLMGVENGGAVALLALLLLSAMGHFFIRQRPLLNVHETLMLLAILAYVLIFVFNLLYFGAEASNLNNTENFILLLPIYFYLRKNPVDERYISIGIFLGAAACAVYAGYQRFELGHQRASGLTHLVEFGGFSMIFAMLCLVFSVYSKSLIPKLIFFCGFPLGVFASMLSGSRGSWLALVTGSVFLVILNPFSWRLRSRLTALLLFTLMILGSYFHPIVEKRVDKAVQEIDQYFETGVVSKASLGRRLETWRASVIAIRESSPWIGIGEGNFREKIQQLVERGLADPDILPMYHAHNVFIAATMNRGVPGLISLILVLLLPFLSFILFARNQSDNHAKALPYSGAMLVVCAVTVAMSDVFFYQHKSALFFVTYIYLLYALLSSRYREMLLAHNNDGLQSMESKSTEESVPK